MRTDPTQPLPDQGDASESRLRDLLSLSSDWLWEMDADFRFTQLQGGMLWRSGIQSDSSIGKCRWELDIQGVTDDQWREHKAQLERHEPFQDFVYQYVNSRGETRWLSINGMPFFDAQGHFAGYRGTGHDITAQKSAELALRESEVRLRALLELSSDWYWVQDSEYRLIQREGAILHKMGLPPERDLGKRPWEMGFFNMTDAQWTEHRALLERREEFRDQLLGRLTPDGRPVWGLFSGRPRFDAQGQFIGYHGIGRGVTTQIEAERARNDRETELSLLVENAPASIALFDAHLILQLVNAGYERLWQRSAADVVGKHLRELVDEASYRQIEPHFNRALAGVAGSYRRTGADSRGQPHIIEVTIAPHCDSDGKVIGVYGIAVDATERIQNEETVRSLQHLFTSTFQNTTDLMAIYRVEPEHLVIEGFNQALWRFYQDQYPGIDMAAWHGRTIDEFLREVSGLSPEDIEQRLASFWEVVRTGAIKRYQTTLPTTSGLHRRDALLVPITSQGGRVTHLFYRGADITDLVRKEQALQALNAELERKVAERTAELSTTNSELEAFAYAVSHDLRTPLRGIDGFSKLLDEEYGERLGEGGASYVQRIRRGISRMGALIDDMLHLSHVTRGPLNRASVDLSAIAEDVAQDLQSQAPTRQVVWRITPGITAVADPGQMRLLLENLLGNAFKYSRNAATAEISVESVPRDDATEFIVRDNGAGFDMAYAGKLFQPFQRLHGRKEFEGTGIGLATVMRVVTRHGGSITAAAAPGKGAQFRVVLPPNKETS